MTNSIDNNLTGLLVQRSDVPVGLEYTKYRQFLRKDFFYACAYCTMMETEAQAIRFCIDHYEPQSAREDLKDDYTNLMYSCDECNSRKGDIFPPDAARADGLRFFRPDHDIYCDHYEQDGPNLKAKTPTGSFNIDYLDLNRYCLRRLRDFRARLTRANDFIVGGVLALRKTPIDRLPQNVKGRAVGAIKKCGEVAEYLAHEIDEMLREHSHSEMIDPPPETEEEKTRTAERFRRQNDNQAIYPGVWRGRQTK